MPMYTGLTSAVKAGMSLGNPVMFELGMIISMSKKYIQCCRQVCESKEAIWLSSCCEDVLYLSGRWVYIYIHTRIMWDWRGTRYIPIF